MGSPPSVEEILQQFAQMRNALKKILRYYCLKFTGVNKLDMKPIAHFGDVEEFKIDRFFKLYGNTLVDALRLLKNSVPSNAYVLLTTDYLEQIAEFPLDYSTTCGTYQCDIYDVGTLCYRYFPFDEKDAPHSLFYNNPNNLPEINLSENMMM